MLSLVGRVGGKKLINFVADIATGQDAARRKLGIDALSKWPDASVADKLLEIANQATDPAERSQAFQGYVKISATRDKRTDEQRLDRMKQAMKLAKTPEEQSLVINRCRTAYDVDTLRFVLPYVDQPQFAQVACETIVELAHHREIRDPEQGRVRQGPGQGDQDQQEPRGRRSGQSLQARRDLVAAVNAAGLNGFACRCCWYLNFVCREAHPKDVSLLVPGGTFHNSQASKRIMQVAVSQSRRDEMKIAQRFNAG